jgi:hypothetical protein
LTLAIEFDVKLTGIEGITAKLDRLAAGNYMREAMDATVIEIETWMKRYPPKPAAMQGPAMRPVSFMTSGGQAVSFTAASRGWKRGGRNGRGKLRYVGYQRTGGLGRSWTHRVTGAGVEFVGNVGTNIKYAKWVQSAEKQAAVHQGRWRTDEQAIAQFKPRIVKRFEAAIRRAMR